MVAEARKPIRISGLFRPMLYALAMHRASQEPGDSANRLRVPLPGLPNPERQLGVPLLVRDELVGVLVIESEVPYRFHEEDKTSIELLGTYLAIAMQNMQLQERARESPELGVPAAPAPASTAAALPPAPAVATDRRKHGVVYYAADECILVNGEYLIRSLPAKILWKLLNARNCTGRSEFTNRELRLDKSLNLPEWKDNLESRLLLLKRRLQQKCPEISLVSRARGRFSLELSCEVELESR
jgi:hypothetical protein